MTCPFHPAAPTPAPSEPASLDRHPDLATLHERLPRERVSWLRPGELAVLDPASAHRANADNSRDLRLPPKRFDRLLGRQSQPITWKEMRGAWLAQLRRLNRDGGARSLAARMDRLLDARLGDDVDLVLTLQEVFGRSLLPVVIDGLGTDDALRLERDQDLRIAGILSTGEPSFGWRDLLRMMGITRAATRAVRRELRGRATGRRPRRLDLTDVLVERFDDLGSRRAVAAVFGILAAIGGPPGAAGVCLAYELVRHPQWADRLAAELDGVPENRFLGDPVGTAPTTHRFVQEVLRLWSPPLLLTRPVREELDVDGEHLEPGQSLLLSPHLMQRDPRHWSDPERFDPDRFLPDGEASRPGACWVPFGFAPRACLGAKLGLDQLLVLAHRLTTRYRIELDTPVESIPLALEAVPIPLGFRGRLVRRAAAL